VAPGDTLEESATTNFRERCFVIHAQIPLVDYLALQPAPKLVANECMVCKARFFDRRNGCASCGARSFVKVPVATSGKLRAFTVVAYAAPGIEVPFVAGIIDCEGTTVRANIIGVDANPEVLFTGMKVRLATYSLGVDDDGTEAVGFGFTPDPEACNRTPPEADS
jgi:uncharacterized protein